MADVSDIFTFVSLRADQHSLLQVGKSHSLSYFQVTLAQEDPKSYFQATLLVIFWNFQKSTEHANREICPTTSLTKMHTGVYTKMSTEMPTKVEAFSVSNIPEGPHEHIHESAHGKFSSAHENVHESVLGQFSHILFSHVLFLAQTFSAIIPATQWKIGQRPEKGKNTRNMKHCPQLKWEENANYQMMEVQASCHFLGALWPFCSF